MIPKYKAFPRGYEFKNFEGQPEEKLIQIKIPARVTIPLRQGFGNEVIPIVKPGQPVKAGQIIARDDESVSNPVHSSVNGEVAKIDRIEYLGREVGAITIESDGTGDWQKLQGCSSDPQGLSAEKTGELIYLSGAGSGGSTGIPTGFNSSVITPSEVENVIIRGLGAEVYNPSLELLLKGQKLSHFTEGLKILKKLMAHARFHLVLDKTQKSLINKLSQSLPNDDSFSFSTTAPKYSVSYDEVLIPLLLGKKFPYGYSSANIGVIVLDIQAVLHVYEAVVEGKPLIERTAALCGPGFRENPHVSFRIGSSLEHIVQGRIDTDKNLRFVLNSCLTGQRISELSLPADRTFTTIIAMLEDNESEFLSFARPGFTKDSYSQTCFSMLFRKNNKLLQKKCGTNLHGELRPCIFCTFCQEVCPAGIIPHLLFQHVERDVIDENLLRYKIFDCIECNLCSYVCPSKVPVAEFIKKGKSGLISEGFEIP
ncbi:MAG: 4Fe-4S dicluster domain-containing protein, partial [Planctomycetes bacterium]|nr:4Fe-4S dicluster domain-containing protein [Planctomycetota bacterium]